uniref:Uncharacterized protein n=1 Tax=Peronospora matthiolae TaxID=2874970 RepID=A0AAV1TAH8_9STRA
MQPRRQVDERERGIVASKERKTAKTAADDWNKCFARNRQLDLLVESRGVARALDDCRMGFVRL